MPPPPPPPPPPAAAADAFGTPRFHCEHASGCLCTDFVCTLDAMPVDDRSALEASRNTLTCQRKSELVLLCSCGHAAWEHSSEPRAPGTDEQNGVEDERGEWHAVLNSGADLLHLCESLECLPLAEAYELLDEGRLTLMRRLLQVGVNALRDRQGVCNALGKARRLAALEENRARQRKGVERWTALEASAAAMIPDAPPEREYLG